MRSLGVLLILLLASLEAGRCSAQIYDDPFQDLAPTRGKQQERGGAALTFQLLTKISLPGPLPTEGPRWIDGRIEIPVAGGIAFTSTEAGAQPVIDALSSRREGPPVEDTSTLDAQGLRRFRTEAPGFLVAEKRCHRCARGWKTVWRLRAAGVSLTPPLVEGGQVFFGGSDNQVHCVKARNGHRVWSRDMEARVMRRLVLWSGIPEGPVVVLAVLEEGASLIALSASTGSTVSSLDFESGHGHLVQVPAMTDEGKIVVARQEYDQDEATLLVYSLGPVPEPPPTTSAGPLPASPSTPRTTTSG